MSENLKENALNSDGINSDVDVGEGSNDDINSVSSGSEWHTGYIQGNTFENKQVKYMLINGKAVFEGDIILASTPKQIERLGHKLVKGIGIKTDENEKYRWPNRTAMGEIPYTIDPNLPKPDRVTKAIQHWESRTRIRFVKRTDSNSGYYPHYLVFKRNEDPAMPDCHSAIGMQGWGEQDVSLRDGCALPHIIHELGDAVVLWDEQS